MLQVYGSGLYGRHIHVTVKFLVHKTQFFYYNCINWTKNALTPADFVSDGGKRFV